MAKWETQVSANQPQWTVLTPEIDTLSDGGQRFYLQKDGSFLATGYAPTKFSVKFTAKTDLPNITAFRLELMTDPNLPMNGPGRSIQGTCALTEFEAEADGTKNRSSPKRPPTITSPRKIWNRSSMTKPRGIALPAPLISPSTVKTKPRGASTPVPAGVISRTMLFF